MNKYLVAYFGGPQFKSKEDGAEYQKKWMAWMEELKDIFIDEGVPMGPAKVVTSEEVSDRGEGEYFSGFSIIQAEDIDAATEILQACPHLEHGRIEVGEAMSMTM